MTSVRETTRSLHLTVMTLPYEGLPVTDVGRGSSLASRVARWQPPQNGKKARRLLSVVRDIREGPVEEYWDRLREMMGPGGLITYWSLVRGFNQEVDPDTVRLRRDMRNNAGGIMAAPLAIAAPETGGWRDREVVPAPVTYALHILDPAPDVRAVRVTRETVRRGRKIGFSRSVVTDADDPRRIIALTSGTGVSLGAAPSGFRPVDLPPDLPEVDLPPLHVVFGARRDPDGWRLPELTTRLAS